MSVTATRARTGSVTKRVRKDGTHRYGVQLLGPRAVTEPRWELQPPGTSLAPPKRGPPRPPQRCRPARRGRDSSWRSLGGRTPKVGGEQAALVRAGSLKPGDATADYKGSPSDNHLDPSFTGLRLDEMTRADSARSSRTRSSRASSGRRRSTTLLVSLGLILRQAGEDGCTVNSPEARHQAASRCRRTEMEWYEVAEAETGCVKAHLRGVARLDRPRRLRRPPPRRDPRARGTTSTGRTIASTFAGTSSAPTSSGRVGGRARFAAPPRERPRHPLRPTATRLRTLLEEHRRLASRTSYDLRFRVGATGDSARRNQPRQPCLSPRGQTCRSAPHPLPRSPPHLRDDTALPLACHSQGGGLGRPLRLENHRDLPACFGRLGGVCAELA